jgi:hypothetical protein
MNHMRSELARHLLSHPQRRHEAKQEQGSRVVKDLHVRQTDDGTLHHERHMENGLQIMDSTRDLDELHDLLEEHFGGEPNEGEEHADGEEEREEHYGKG